MEIRSDEEKRRSEEEKRYIFRALRIVEWLKGEFFILSI